MIGSPNLLLSALPDDVFTAVEPHLKTVDLVFGDVLSATGDVVNRVYFPHSGVISLVVELSLGEAIETAMIGRDGAFNAASALDGKMSFNKGLSV